MKVSKKLTALLMSVVTAFSLSSCVDLGVGDEDDSFKDYISSVLLLSPLGRTRRSIHRFNKDIHLGDTVINDDVVPYRAYSYIGFKVSTSYDVTVDEFALFAKLPDIGVGEEGKEVELEMYFYVDDHMPTKLGGLFGDDDVYLPEEPDYTDDSDYDDAPLEEAPKDDEGNPTDREGEVTEDDLQGKYFSSSMTVSSVWSSVLFEFEQPQEVKRGDYIIIKILNNCVAKDYDTADKNVRFTVNHLMFRFTHVSTD